MEGYDFIDLCQKVGATQLLPENADYFAELIRCSALVAGLPKSAAGLFRITDIEYHAWINSTDPMESAPEMGGDPQEGLFAAEIPYYGGAYLVLPVEYADDAFVLECLLEAASHGMNNRKFEDEVAHLAILGLAISDLCLRKAGISRHTEPASSDNEEIRWLRGTEARHLQECVSFDRDEIECYVAQLGIRTSGLDHLAFQEGAIPATYEHLRQNPVRSRPLLATRDRIVLISPMTVNNAIRDAVLQVAREMRLVADLMSAYRDVVSSRVDLNARRLGWTERASNRIVRDNVVVDEQVYSTDVDKVMVTYLVTDSLIHGDTSVEDSHWDIKPSLAMVESRISTNNRQLNEVFGQAIDIVHCVIPQGVGRSYIMGAPESEHPNSYSVSCSADELRVFALLNLNDALAMWRVAVSLKRTPKHMSMLGGFLDHYALYRNRDESYYFGDDGIPDAVFFVASGIEPRLDVARTLDPHLVPTPDGESTIRVFRFQNRPDFQVYAPEPHTVDGIELFVECLPCPTWVVACDACDLSDGEERSASFHLIDSVAFWLWQLTPDILNLVGDTTGCKSFTIEVDSTRFIPGNGHSMGPPTTGIEYSRQCNGSGRMTFSQDFASHCARPENTAELELARVLLRAFATEFNAEIDNDTEETILASHWCNGHKRRMAIIEGALAGMLDTQDLPAPCKVLPFDEQLVQDQVAKGLHLSGAINEGVLPDSERHSILNKAVAMMYRELQELVSLHSSEELIVKVVASHESLVAERRHLESVTNTHLACFGHSEQNVRELQRDIAEIDRASIANRFLIEYTAARPPQGTKPFSQARYLRMLAIAASIFRTGQLSDSLRYGLSEHSITLLKSRRIQIHDTEYDAAMAAFHNAFFDRVVKSGLSEREQRSKRLGNQDAIDHELLDLNTATKAEFGFPISQICRFLTCIASSSFTTSAGVGHCTTSELRSHLQTELSLDQDDIGRLLSIFTLVERPDYLRPPDPYKPADVYPWIFNRKLSYLRRPLIVHGDYMTWGTRAIHQAGNYLFDICLRGRLKEPTSEEMCSYQGAAVNRLGNAFNDEISDLLRSTGEYLIRPRVKKLNGKRLSRENGEDIGDIDVLAVSVPARVIFPIEAKCFSLAKTPAEVGRERDELFGDMTTSLGKIGRHLERVAWLHSNIRDVLHEFGLPDEDGWVIEPFIVLDVDLISVHLSSSPINIATQESLVEMLMATMASQT